MAWLGVADDEGRPTVLIGLQEKRLGRGATGSVFRARDIISGEIVAIKKIERGHRVGCGWVLSSRMCN